MLEQQLADKLTEIGAKQFLAWEKFVQPRFNQIKKYERAYNNDVDKALPGEFNVPIPILGGFVDTLMSKVDDAPELRFGYNDEADYKKSKIVTAQWKKDSSASRGKWGRKDRAGKKLACFAGYVPYKCYAESEPQYKSNLHVIDYYSFIFEPNGGADLDNHLFQGEKDIFKSEHDLTAGAESGLYSPEQVRKLIADSSDDDHKKADEAYKNKSNRFTSLKLDPVSNNYVGDILYNLVELVMVHEGTKYYLLFDPKTKIWVRADYLKKVNKRDIAPYAAWHTHEDEFNFMSKSPCDDVYPIHEATRILINGMLTNINRRNKPMRAYDPSMFDDPEMLQYLPDRWLPANAISKNTNIEKGIYEFSTPDTSTVTINLVEFFDNFLGRKTGITPEAQGSSNEKMVGIYYGNLQQVADRLGLINNYYSECYVDLGKRWLYGAEENITEDESVKILGAQGVEWHEVTRDDMKPYRDFDIEVISTSAEMKADEAKKAKRQQALAEFKQNPNLATLINPKWLAEEVLRTGDYSDEEIRSAMDLDNYGNKDILAEASSAIKEIIQGGKPKKYRGANTAFIQRILDYAMDTDVDDVQFDALMVYANSHMDIAIENAGRQAAKMISEIKAKSATDNGAPALPSNPNPLVPNNIVPGANGPAPTPASPSSLTPDMPGFGASAGQNASNMLSK